jgi:hypothetical protein
VTKRRRFKIRFGLGLAVAAIALGAPATAQAENVVPNTPAPQRGVGKGVVIEVRQRHASVRFTPAADELYARYRGAHLAAVRCRGRETRRLARLPGVHHHHSY